MIYFQVSESFLMLDVPSNPSNRLSQTSMLADLEEEVSRSYSPCYIMLIQHIHTTYLYSYI